MLWLRGFECLIDWFFLFMETKLRPFLTFNIRGWGWRSDGSFTLVEGRAIWDQSHIWFICFNIEVRPDEKGNYNQIWIIPLTNHTNLATEIPNLGAARQGVLIVSEQRYIRIPLQIKQLNLAHLYLYKKRPLLKVTIMFFNLMGAILRESEESVERVNRAQVEL